MLLATVFKLSSKNVSIATKVVAIKFSLVQVFDLMLSLVKCKAS